MCKCIVTFISLLCLILTTQLKLYFISDQNQSGERKMFLMRVCLGDIFITKTCNKYKRPPCKTCGSDFCTTHPELYDSVVAEFNMRELVVYDSSKCYPEYLITYKWSSLKICLFYIYCKLSYPLCYCKGNFAIKSKILCYVYLK